MTSQRYIVLSKHPVYGVRSGHYVYLTDEEGARKTASGHVEPAPPPKRKPKRTRHRTVTPTVVPPDEGEQPEPDEHKTDYRTDPSPS